MKNIIYIAFCPSCLKAAAKVNQDFEGPGGFLTFRNRLTYRDGRTAVRIARAHANSSRHTVQVEAIKEDGPSSKALSLGFKIRPA